MVVSLCQLSAETLVSDVRSTHQAACILPPTPSSDADHAASVDEKSIVPGGENVLVMRVWVGTVDELDGLGELCQRPVGSNESVT